MRRIVVAALLAMTLVPSYRADADDLGTWHEISFNAPIPCSMVCPYWLDDVNTDADANGKEDIYFQACANPDGTSDAIGGVPGIPWTKGTVFDDVVVGPAPEGARVLEWELTPTVEWDGFFCAWQPGDVGGEELPTAWCGAPSRTTCAEPEPCGLLYGVAPVGCPEYGLIEAIAGRRYILRAYNWSDPLPLTARYRFRGASPTTLGGGS